MLARYIFVFLLGACALAQEPLNATTPYLRPQDGKLFIGEREFRAIGITMPFAYRIFYGPANKGILSFSMGKSSLDISRRITLAAECGLSFIRLGISPDSNDIGYSAYEFENDPPYTINRDAFWKKMDELFHLCGTCGIRIIPTIYIFPSSFQRVTGEPWAAAFDSNSQTHKMAIEFVSQLVGRYKNDPNVLLWEIGRKTIILKHNPMDAIPYEQNLKFYTRVIDCIQSIDQNHAIFYGESDCKTALWHRRTGLPNEKNDHETANIFEESLSDRHHLLGLSIHEDACSDDFISKCLFEKKAGLPVLIGLPKEAVKNTFETKAGIMAINIINNLEKEGGNLIDLWDWNFIDQNKIIERVVNFNRKYGSLPSSFVEQKSNF